MEDFVTAAHSNAIVGNVTQHANVIVADKGTAAAERKAPTERKETAQGASGKLEGIDVFVQWDSRNAETLAATLQKAVSDSLKLVMISNRGVKVWPQGIPETFCTESFRCRFLAEGAVSAQQVIALQGRVIDCGVEISKTENLRSFDGKPGYTLAQGQ